MVEPANPKDQPDAAGSGGDQGVNQSDIDALVGAAEGAAAQLEEPQDEPTQSQSDIDAMFGATEESAAPSGDSQADSAQSQGDIDAMFGDSGGSTAPSDDSQAVETESPPPDTRVDTLGRPFDEAAAAMQAAIEEEQANAASSRGAPAQSTPAAAPPPLDSRPFDLPEIGTTDVAGIDSKRVTMLNDVKLQVKIELGRTRMLVEDVLQLGEGSVVELDKPAGDPVEVYVNDRLVARGEVLVLNDNFCVRISDVLESDPHRVST